MLVLLREDELGRDAVKAAEKRRMTHDDSDPPGQVEVVDEEGDPHAVARAASAW
jgi:hypothetical protein